MSRIQQQLIPFAMALAVSTGVLATPFAAQVQAAQLADAGNFRDADRGHPANGRAEIIRLKGGGLGLKLHSDFKVRSGPDLRVWLSGSANPTSAASVNAAKHIDLGRLKSSSGEQIYRIPANVKLSELGSVVIWCRAFGVYFGGANLR